MGIIRLAIDQPITVAVGVLLLTLFGALALGLVPVQLTPNVDRPQAQVMTLWPGASALEVEREIVDEQEKQLKGLDGLLKLESTSSEGMGDIIMEFPVGTDVDSILLRVNNRLQMVPAYPPDADKPLIFSTHPAFGASAWFGLSAQPGNDVDMDTLKDWVEDEILPRFERVSGVAQAQVFGGRERQMQVIVDPKALAARMLTLTDVADALAAENQDYSAGEFDEGKRRYTVRTAGDYRSAADVENVIVTLENGAPVYVRDIAEVRLGFEKRRIFVRQRGVPGLAFSVSREAGSNALDVMGGVRAAAEEIRRDLTGPRGLRMDLVFDETEYIDASIGLVRSNIFIGGALAVMVLLIFLRSLSGTGIVALSIPISVVATFLVMAISGRSINVISLAGLAFAVGMVVDNCIVVLENIFRHRQMGKKRKKAALDGATEVWGAVLASTLTTVAVFLPVISVEDEAGQLFRDIAIAISAAVLLSLATAMTVIPTLTARILGRGAANDDRAASLLHRADRALGLFARLPEALAALTVWLGRGALRRVAVVVGLTALSLGGSWLLMPRAEYLPTGNSNYVQGFLIPPPGYNVEELLRIAHHVEDHLRPYWEVEPGSPEAEALAGGGIGEFFFVAWGQTTFMGARANDGSRARELQDVLQESLNGIVGAYGIASQASIFARSMGESRVVFVDLRGPDLEELVAAGGALMGTITTTIPGLQARPLTTIDLGNPELRLVPDRRRMADVGLTNRELGFTMNALVDGAKVSDYRIEGREIDLVLKASEEVVKHGQELAAIPITTSSGQMITVGSVTDIVEIGGPVAISHIERQRAVRIAAIPPEELPLERAMELIREDVIAPARESGLIPESMTAHLSGTADDLTRTRDALMGNFLLALAVTYLLMAALFQSWLYPLVIMFSVPLAMLGGFLGLRLVNAVVAYQAMDILTMLGFVILIGIVVNNAILIVHQCLNMMRREGRAYTDALPEAVRIRVRPIFMSTLTSIFGMLPLVLFPGSGSELYRGLGSVVIGGLALSTVFTLLVVPSLFSLTLDAKGAILRLFRGSGRRAGPEAALP
jgi:HAE1 family hydrophobic/amphiphilic exporter-1